MLTKSWVMSSSSRVWPVFAAQSILAVHLNNDAAKLGRILYVLTAAEGS